MTPRATLKTWFETGDKPTQAQFAELIDSLFHPNEDTLSIDRIDGLQDALDSKAPASGAEDVVPITLANGSSGNIIVGDKTLHSSIHITYSLIRGSLVEMGVIRIENRENTIIVHEADFDECGFTFSKNISENDLRIGWTDDLTLGNNGLLYLIDVKRTVIPV
ncbi:MAG: hypothetical protein JXB49_26055 [Bacteroidales bacterium]|nr:hypothetical protein [Bacteroidales bacterium]